MSVSMEFIVGLIFNLVNIALGLYSVMQAQRVMNGQHRSRNSPTDLEMNVNHWPSNDVLPTPSFASLNDIEVRLNDHGEVHVAERTRSTLNEFVSVNVPTTPQPPSPPPPTELVIAEQSETIQDTALGALADTQASQTRAHIGTQDDSRRT